jgi:hypothetical protein
MNSDTPNTSSAASTLQNQNQNITDIEEGRSQTLANITDLQNIEKEYFSKLTNDLAQNALTQEEKDNLVQKINQISQMRINLYKNLDGMYSFYHSNVASTRNTIDEQSIAIDIVEKELNESKLKMKEIEQEKYNKLRLVEINNYYSEQYNDHSGIMKTIIIICIPVLILTILSNRGFLPRNLYLVLLIIIVVIGVIYLGKNIIYSMSHDNMNYQEYTWNFKPENAPQVDTSGTGGVDPWDNSTNDTCQGQACCDTGYIYDSSPSINKCIPTDSLTDSSNTSNAVYESMSNMKYISGASENVFGNNSNFASYKKNK